MTEPGVRVDAAQRAVPRTSAYALPLVAAVMATTLTACGMRLPFFSSGPGGSYFSTKVCGVYLDGKSKEARLRIELEVTRSLPRNGFVEIEFENPSDRKVLLVTGRTVTGNERTLELLSPPLTVVRARGYETVTRVYASADKKQVLGIHTQLCQSLVDERKLGL